MPWIRSKLLPFVVLCAVFTAARADATVVVPLTREELVHRADLIVRASVGTQRSMWNENHTQIITLTTLTVTAAWKGNAPQTLTLRQFGGTVGELTSRVAGDSQLRRGQDAIFFLRQGSGVVYLTALAQSVYTVSTRDGTPRVARDLAGLTFARVDNAGPMQLIDATSERSESLSSFVADLARLLGGAR